MQSEPLFRLRTVYMTRHSYINIKAAVLTAVIAAVLFGTAVYRIRIDADVISSLPHNDPVISDARHILLNHPIHDRIVIDVSCHPQNPDVLVGAAGRIEKKLAESGLFESVGVKDAGNVMAGLIFYISENLPYLFSEKDLQEIILPMTEPDQIRTKLESGITRLQMIDGIGQADLLSKDPLDFRNTVMAKLSHLAPSESARIYKGQIFSADGGHLLIIAKPFTSGSDTSAARKITSAIRDASEELRQEFDGQGYVFTLTPSGAYRAALDNEEYAKADVQNSLLWATVGIGLLLIFTFPRPLIGLLSFVPAFVGTIAAFFVFSLFHESVSIMTLGFGGAIISITVDQGIAYLLFLDQKHETRGKEAASEVWGFGLLVTLTTVIAFLMLSFSGFPILAEIGQFATLGGIFSFIFVHTVFPKIFPVMPPSKSQRRLPVHDLINRFAMSHGKKKAWAALGFALVMLIFAKPVFRVDLSAMNTVSDDTKAAETLMTAVWGNIFNKIYLLVEADDIRDLRTKADDISRILEQEIRSGSLASAAMSSMILPGPVRAEQQFDAWRRFWNADRKEAFISAFRSAASASGFSEDAFEPFYQAIDPPDQHMADIPPEFYELLGVSGNADQTGWMLFCSMTPGIRYNAPEFYSKFKDSAKLFDPVFFSERLGTLLASAFLRMLVIVGVSTMILLAIVFFNWKLSAIVIAPSVFAFICTLGTLKLLGRPIDIPGIMLAIVILGMGVDYSICFVHSYRRYRDESHPSFGLIRVSVFLAAVTAIIGFGVLSVSNHLLLRSAGFVSAVGVGYSLIGTFLIIPALMNRGGK